MVPLLLLSACSASAPVAHHRVLTVAQAETTLWPGEIQVAYQPPTEQQRRSFDELVQALWRGVVPGRAPELVALATRAGMVLELWTIAERPTWVVREAPRSQHGFGIYMFHAAPIPPGRPILLQAPHVYFDLRTQSVAAAMFWGRDVPAEVHGLFANSVHRFQQAEGVRGKLRFNPADVAHNSEHPFQNATAVVMTHGPVVVIQLHGFDGETNETAAAIVSASRPEGSTEESSRVATSLASALGITVARYPEDTQALGGLDNVQGRLAALFSTTRFIHIELQLGVRKQLADGAVAQRWLRALVDELAAVRPPKP
ncbi:MAG: hypothetical protein AB7O24_25955 [Kofleriaceae bacterium]